MKTPPPGANSRGLGTQNGKTPAPPVPGPVVVSGEITPRRPMLSVSWPPLYSATGNGSVTVAHAPLGNATGSVPRRYSPSETEQL